MDKKIEEAYQQLLSRTWGDVPVTPTYAAYVKQSLPKLRKDLQNNAHLGVAEKLDRLLDVLHEGVRNGDQTNFAQNLQELKNLCRTPTQHLNTPVMWEAILLIVLGSLQGAQSCAETIAKIKAEYKKDNMYAIPDEIMNTTPQRSSSHSSKSSNGGSMGTENPQLATTNTEELNELQKLFYQVEERYHSFLQEESNEYWHELKTIIYTPFVTALALAESNKLPEDYLNFLKMQAAHGVVDFSGHSKACEMLPAGEARQNCEYFAHLFKVALEKAEQEMHYTAVQEAGEKNKQLEREMQQVQLNLEEANKEKQRQVAAAAANKAKRRGWFWGLLDKRNS